MVNLARALSRGRANLSSREVIKGKRKLPINDKK